MSSESDVLARHVDPIAEILAEAIRSGDDLGALCAVVIERGSDLFADCCVAIGYAPEEVDAAVYGTMSRGDAAEMFVSLGKPQVGEAVAEKDGAGEVPVVLLCRDGYVLVSSVGMKVLSAGTGRKELVS